MAGPRSRMLRALLFIPLLVGTASAFAQVRLPGVTVAIPVPKIGDVQVGLPRVEVPRNVLDVSKTVPALVGQPLPKLDVKLESPVIPKTSISLGVGGSLARPEVGLSAGATVPGSLPVPDSHATAPVPGERVAERRLDEIPYCR